MNKEEEIKSNATTPLLDLQDLKDNKEKNKKGGLTRSRTLGLRVQNKKTLF